MSRTSDIDEVAHQIGIPIEQWRHNCHVISLAIVKAGLVPSGRVARGVCRGVPGQHSWIVDGPDCYDIAAPIIDPTVWSYVGTAPLILHTTATEFGYRPHGAGSIWDHGCPTHRGGDTVHLDRGGLSTEARMFLDMVGPLDHTGWMSLFNAPVGGWPAKEIMTAADAHPDLAPLIPVDVLGMVTDLNPGGLYR
jgi:hypothetical protein